jgi:hypothetical protein
MTTLRSGPTDRSVAAEGSWSIDGKGHLLIQTPEGSSERLNVLEVDIERLVIEG